MTPSQHAQDIFTYYKQLREEGGHPLGEARVLVVGEGRVGKTSIIKRLLHDTFDSNEDSTLTVETHSLALGGNRASIWDFGGQDYMHATHPFFFSARCVYLLALDVSLSLELNRVEYWLKTIQTYGGNSPVLIVGNKLDSGHKMDLPENGLREKYPNFKGFLLFSAKDGRGREALRAALEEQVAALPHVRVMFRNSYLAVKAGMEEEKQRENVIARQIYERMCRQSGIEDKADQTTLLNLLHELGVVLDFKDEEGNPLSGEGVLNPLWVTQAVYAILTNREMREDAQGRLEKSMLEKVIKEYEPHHRELIMKLMTKFEICYPEDENHSAYWLPNRMKRDEPKEAGGWENGLRFEYEYPELPESIITRFIVRAHRRIWDGLVWRFGAILQKDENDALVKGDINSKRITINILGAENTRRDFLAILREEFHIIHQTFQKAKDESAPFEIKEFIYCHAHPKIPIDFKELLSAEHYRQPYQLFVEKRPVTVDPSEILNGFITPEARQKEWKLSNPKEAQEEEERMKKEQPTVVKNYYGNVVENGNMIQGNVEASTVAAGKGNTSNVSVENSFNINELKETLEQLTKAVKDILPHLKAEEAESAKDDLERLQEELQKPKPNKKWYFVSIDGLIQAAKNLGELGTPVIKLAGKVLKLLNALP